MEAEHYLLAILGSAFAGAINTLAGNGSAITLTLLTELIGLPGNVANGTNRIGVLSQSLASTYAFHRHDRLQVRGSRLLIALTSLGAVAGILVATRVSNEQFIDVFRFLLLFMLVVILVKPSRWLRPTETGRQPRLWLVVPAFLALGFYGGFIQMGMGVFFLAATVLGARYSLIDANAIKAAVVAVYTLLAVALFAYRGMIDWRVGLIFAIGQTAGGYFTALYAARFPSANVWAYRVLVLVVVLAIVKLFDLHRFFF